MKKLIIITTIAFLATTTIATLTSHDVLLQAFAGDSALLQLVRVAAIGLLVSFLFIEPPRSLQFRVFIALSAVALGLGAGALALRNYMAPLDAVLLIEVAVIFAIEALELPLIAKKPVQRSMQTNL